MNSASRTRQSRLRCWKRFGVFSLCYFLCYTPYRGLRDLQSTLNNTGGTGLASLSVINGCAAVAGLLVPAVVRLKLGTRWSIVLATILYTLYSASNYYPNAYLLLSAAVLPGIGHALFWVSSGTYITTISMELAAVHDRNPTADLALLSSMFYSVSRMSTVCGNMVSFLVFRQGQQLSGSKERNNQTLDLGSCGIRACGGDSVLNTTSALVPPDESSRNLLISLYLGCGASAVVIAMVFLERVPAKTSSTTDRGEAGSLTTSEFRRGIMSAFHLMRRPRMILLIPAMCFNGVEVAFASGHFTKFFVGCTQGIESVGFVAMSLYLTSVLCSPVIGRLIKYTGRVPVFIAGVAVYLLLLIVMILWDPEGGRLWHLFAMASGIGFCRASMTTVNMTLLGLLFPDQREAGFGNLCFWVSIGFASNALLGIPQSICAVHVIAVTMVILLVVVLLYSILEFRIRNDEQQQKRMQYVVASSKECDENSHGSLEKETTEL